MYIKPIIKAFRWRDGYMAIDWETTERAFHITRPDGGAGIFIPPPPNSSYEHGIWSGIDIESIRRFILRSDSGTGLTEVVLEVTYGAGEERLGMTDQTRVAEKWVNDANLLVSQALEKRRGE